MGATLTHKSSATCLLLPVTVSWGQQHHLVQALTDLGAASNFMDASLASNQHLPLTSLDPPVTITALDGRNHLNCFRLFKSLLS